MSYQSNLSIIWLLLIWPSPIFDIGLPQYLECQNSWLFHDYSCPKLVIFMTFWGICFHVEGMTCNDRRSLPKQLGVWGCYNPPAGPGKSPSGAPEGEALDSLKTLHFTVPNIGQNPTLQVHFHLCVLHTKSNSFFWNGNIKIQLNAQNNDIYTLVYTKENGKYSCLDKLRFW